jgi:UDPglucose 6-dehydrogenase
LVDIYLNWIPRRKILTTNVWSSELSKLASNAMLAQRISSINSLSSLCEKTGANINEVSKAIGLDHRIGEKFLNPSPGFGGSCFQKDILNLVYLCKFYGLDEVAEYWHQVVKINDYQKDRFAQKIIAHFGGDLTGKKIAILGWAFKAITNDSRESAAIFVTQKLYDAGATLEVYDPQVTEESIIKDINFYWDKKSIQINKKLTISKKLPIGNDIDAIAILTEWEEFRNLNIDYHKVFDGRKLLKDPLYSIGKG